MLTTSLREIPKTSPNSGATVRLWHQMCRYIQFFRLMGCLSEPRYHLTTPFPHQAKEDHVSGQWWMSFFPGAALILMTAGFILIGDGVNARSER
jgi:hypothetical protein